jgi:hypothetical protein
MTTTSVSRPTRPDRPASVVADRPGTVDGTLRGDPDRPGRAAYGQRRYVTGTNPDLRYLPAGRDPWDTTHHLRHHTRQDRP